MQESCESFYSALLQILGESEGCLTYVRPAIAQLNRLRTEWATKIDHYVQAHGQSQPAKEVRALTDPFPFPPAFFGVVVFSVAAIFLERDFPQRASFYQKEIQERFLSIKEDMPAVLHSIQDVYTNL